MDHDELQRKIADLADVDAVKLLNTVAKPYAAGGPVERGLRHEQMEALRRELHVPPGGLETSDGRIARLALQVMAQNPESALEIRQLLIEPDVRVAQVLTPVQDLDSPTLLYALRTSVNFDEDDRGRTSVRVTSVEPNREVLREFVSGLLGRLPKAY